jgi:hypothetical protein
MTSSGRMPVYSNVCSPTLLLVDGLMCMAIASNVSNAPSHLMLQNPG